MLDVIRIPPDKIEDKPGGITGARAEYIRGLGRTGADDKDIIIILNLPTLLDAKDFVLRSGNTTYSDEGEGRG